jgi:hypothetical protein
LCFRAVDKVNDTFEERKENNALRLKGGGVDGGAPKLTRIWESGWDWL